MSFKEVKKRLAVVLSVAMVLTMMPSSAFSALAELWKVTAITPASKQVTMEAGGKESITFTATVEKATESDANTIVATDSDAALATALNAMEKSLQYDSNVVSASVTSVSQNSITVEVIAKDVTEVTKTELTVKYGELVGKADITVNPKPAIKSVVYDPAVITVGEGANALVNLKAVFNEFADKKEEKDALWNDFIKDAFGSNTTYKEDVINISYVNDSANYMAKVTIKAKAKGTTDLTTEVGDLKATCKVTVTDATPKTKIASMVIKPENVVVKNGESETATLKFTFSDKNATAEAKKEAFAGFWAEASKAWAEVFANNEYVSVTLPKTAELAADDSLTLTIKGKKVGGTKLTLNYKGEYAEKDLRVTCDVTVSAQKGDVEAVPVAPSVDAGAVKPADDLSEEDQKIITDSAEAIKEAITKGTATVESFDDAAQNELIAALKNKGIAVDENTTVVVKPEITVNNITAKVENKKAVVTSMEADIDVNVLVGNKIEGSLTNYVQDYVTVKVPVPTEFLGNSNYVTWQHKVGTEWGTEGLLSTSISSFIAGGKATLKANSFSPFRMTFTYKKSGGSSISGGSGSRSSRVQTGSWVKAADGIRWWYRNPDGTWPANGWAQLAWNGKTDWYYFDAEGYMLTGWFTDPATGLRYYLHPISDGTQGYMYAGWKQIEGKWYYFSEVHDGTFGHLLVNTTTPDGYVVGADGVWIQ